MPLRLLGLASVKEMRPKFWLKMVRACNRACSGVGVIRIYGLELELAAVHVVQVVALSSSWVGWMLTFKDSFTLAAPPSSLLYIPAT